MVQLPLVLLAVHFVADFQFQSDWMAINKSKRWDVLALHVSIYSACFAFWGWQFVVLTWATHFVTDAVTSRITSKLWFIPLVPIEPGTPVPTWLGTVFGATHYARPEAHLRHWFFVMIGFDQLIHAATLTWTWNLLQ